VVGLTPRLGMARAAAKTPLHKENTMSAILTPLSLQRRRLFAGAAAGAALFALRDAVAQASAAGGDWLEMVKAHHALVAKTFDRMLDSDNKTFLRREMLENTLSYQLTAHSVAEENVLYPALARSGMLSESDRLYLDQAHAKVMNAELEMVAAKDASTWFDKVKALQAAVLKHAKEDEEGNIYPRLRQSLDRQENARLAALYGDEFASVRPPHGLK
jgi:hemerythrin superfamily protein